MKFSVLGACTGIFQFTSDAPSIRIDGGWFLHEDSAASHAT
jgi:hypothetical protein